MSTNQLNKQKTKSGAKSYKRLIGEEHKLLVSERKALRKFLSLIIELVSGQAQHNWREKITQTALAPTGGESGCKASFPWSRLADNQSVELLLTSNLRTGLDRGGTG